MATTAATSATVAEVNEALNSCKDAYNKYTSLAQYIGPYANYATAVATRRGELKTALKRMDDVVETYNKDYMEHAAAGRPGFWARQGFITAGDKALGLFYLSYVVCCVMIAAYVYQNSRTPGRGIAITVLFFVVVGVMMSAAFIRFI
jgi:hypothetical protein